MMTIPRCLLPLCLVSVLVASRAAGATPILDTVSLGDLNSEKAHALVATASEAQKGALDETARVLLPSVPTDWRGGRMDFTMKVDPAQPNYFTVRFWGSDVTTNRLVLYVEGKQIGWFHLGEVENLDSGNEDGSPSYNGRFFYHTSPLPLSLTKGKRELHCEIRAMGPIWGYGGNWEKYQKPMTAPSRPIYRVYTHTGGCFVPPPSEKQGPALENPPTRTAPGEEVLVALKERVNREIEKELAATQPLTEVEMQFLGEAYHTKWCKAYQNPAVVQKVAAGLDNLYALWKKDPKVLRNAPGAYNAGWLRLGPAGDAVRLLAEPLRPLLKENLGSGPARGMAWSEMLQASRDDARHNRPQYTNQTMIVDLNAYRANRGVAAIDPAHALPEAQMVDYLYQSIGIKPWLGSDTDHGPSKPLGDDYWQLTAKGLTKELGYVGYYGEVIDWVSKIYTATRAVTPDGFGEGDPKIKERLIKIAKARAVFRHPMLDADGNRAMRIEAMVGWRDEGHYPGNVAYAERPSWDGSPLFAVAATLDAESVGYAQQMFADNQFFETMRRSMKEGGLRVTAGLLGVPDQYALVKAQKPTGVRLPMSWEQPDFAWADEEDGVLALKHGKEIVYASLYWRARYGINFLARVHSMRPTYDRIAVVAQEEKFTPSGLEYTYPDWINFGFMNGGKHIPYPEDLHQAMTGEKLPIAKIPAGVKFKPGDESPYAGRASFYQLRYGDYLIGMNASKDQTFELAKPAGVISAPELVSKKTITLSGPIKVAPMSTVVLYLGR